MQHITDHAVMLSARKHGETSAIVQVFTRHHGRMAGIVRGASSARLRGIYQPGNVLEISWKARLSEHIGTLDAELLHPVAAWALAFPLSLAAVQSCVALISTALHERDPHPELYDALIATLWRIGQGKVQSPSPASKTTPHAVPSLPISPENTVEGWLPLYALFERDLLAQSGFGLDLSACAVTDIRTDLAYVSPRSGKAVNRAAAGEYAPRLLPLPAFLQQETPVPSAENGWAEGEMHPVTIAEMLDAVALTGYFLEKWLFEPHGQRMPLARHQLLQRMRHYLQPAILSPTTPQPANIPEFA